MQNDLRINVIIKEFTFDTYYETHKFFIRTVLTPSKLHKTILRERKQFQVLVFIL